MLMLTGCSKGATHTELASQPTQMARVIVITATPKPTITLAPTRTPKPTPTIQPLSTAIPPTSTPEPTPTQQPQAHVLAGPLNVREGPSRSYPVITQKQTGDALDVIGRSITDQPWVQVRLSPDRTGWVSANPELAQLSVAIDTLPLAGWYPPTGILQQVNVLKGVNAFKIENDGESDVVVVLAKDARPIVTSYVRGKTDFTIEGIPDGTYEVFYSRGTNWDGQEFMDTSQRAKFVDPFPFETAQTGPSIWTITLQPAFPGTGDPAKTVNVSPGGIPQPITHSEGN